MRPGLAFGLALAAALVLLGCRGQQQAASDSSRAAQVGPPPFDHTIFDQILRARVKDGKVDYRALAQEDADSLQQYLRQLAETDPNGFAGADDELAFWLNAYNAFVIAGVLERYPDIERVTDFPDFFNEKRWSAVGRSLSLDEIENKIIRPRFKDPRIHFILVCAAHAEFRNQAFT